MLPIDVYEGYFDLRFHITYFVDFKAWWILRPDWDRVIQQKAWRCSSIDESMRHLTRRAHDSFDDQQYRREKGGKVLRSGVRGCDPRREYLSGFFRVDP